MYIQLSFFFRQCIVYPSINGFWLPVPAYKAANNIVHTKFDIYLFITGILW